MYQKQKLKIEQTLVYAVATIQSWGGVFASTENTITCIQKITLQLYNRK